MLSLTLSQRILFLLSGIYKKFAKEFNEEFPGKKVSMIDIGTGPGTPLKSIMNQVNFERVLAIDINDDYISHCKDLFKDDDRVEVRKVDFMEADKVIDEKFDIIFFGFSFMLMPDKKKVRFN